MYEYNEHEQLDACPENAHIGLLVHLSIKCFERRVVPVNALNVTQEHDYTNNVVSDQYRTNRARHEAQW